MDLSDEFYIIYVILNFFPKKPLLIIYQNHDLDRYFKWKVVQILGFISLKVVAIKEISDWKTVDLDRNLNLPGLLMRIVSLKPLVQQLLDKVKKARKVKIIA